MKTLKITFANEADCRFVTEIAKVLNDSHPVSQAVARLIRQGAKLQYIGKGRAVTYPTAIPLKRKR